MTSLDFFFIIYISIVVLLYKNGYINNRNIKYIVLVLIILYCAILKTKNSIIFYLDKNSENKFNNKSNLEDSEILVDTYKSIVNFLEANLILHLSMLYMVIIIGIMLFINYFHHSNYKLSILENILGKELFNSIVVYSRLYYKPNKFWLIVIWIALLTATISSVSFSYIIYQDIDLISNIILDK